MYDRHWAALNVDNIPDIKVTPPGPNSRQVHGRTSRFIKGYSSQVRLFPVAFESGHGVTLTDVDGNTYIDFSSGIYVTGLGHCHPKITEAVQKAAGQLMNAHDFSTPIKMQLAEKMAGLCALLRAGWSSLASIGISTARRWGPLGSPGWTHPRGCALRDSS
jgi:4-aminobutyrate aminotransferase-like enzyme